MMFNFRKSRLCAFTIQIARIFRQYAGSKSTSKFTWSTENRNKSKYIGVLLGIGCSVATVTSISYALNEKRDNEPSLDYFKYTSDNGNPSCSYERDERKVQLEAAIKKSMLKLEQVKEEAGSPGLVCAVSIDGKLVWTVGLGFADVENGVKCHDGTVMRIASISKALTSIAIGKLLQESKIDLNLPIQQYVGYFPQKEFNGERVIITLRQLMSHTSGVRHYEKELHENETSENVDKIKENKDEKMRKKDTRPLGKTKDGTKEAESQSKGDREVGKEGKRSDRESESGLSEQEEENNVKNKEEFKMKEYYIKDHFDSIKDAISIFKDDPLLKKPGSDYLYTTHGWTLISACIEGASGKDYITFMKNMCYDLGLDSTVVELNDPIVYNRSNYYIRDAKGKLKNTPYVDNSYKWAGGGFLSTVGDLVKIGNVMLYSSQYEDKTSGRRGYLSKEVVDLFWTPEPVTVGKVSKKRKESSFGLGWQLLPTAASYGCCRETKFAAMHSGAAVGASSILLIMPKGTMGDGCNAVNVTHSKDDSERQMVNKSDRQREGNLVEDDSNLLMKKTGNCEEEHRPQGIVVAIMVNMQEVGLTDTALEIAENFTFEH